MAPPSLWPSETTNLLLYLYAVFQVQCSPLLADKGPHCFLDGALHEAPLSHLPGRAIIDSAAQSIIFPPRSQESRAAAQRWRWSYGLYRLKANELSAWQIWSYISSLLNRIGICDSRFVWIRMQICALPTNSKSASKTTPRGDHASLWRGECPSNAERKQKREWDCRASMYLLWSCVYYRLND